MLRDMEDPEGNAIGATEGVVGHAKDLPSDDEAWIVRYFVVDTGGWLSTAMDSPPLFTPHPLDRHRESSLYEHYGRRSYWADDLKRETEMSRIEDSRPT